MAALMLPTVECIETTDTYGRFVAEPVEKGFGVILGNALRRVLLNSLPGAAITCVVIEGIQHEFSTIPHVVEDTLDILLNTKSVRIRPLSQRPGKLRLEVEGRREVCAGDIITSADFEIANPELHLATLDSTEAKLGIEFTVELGRGYAPADSGDSLAIGAIPIDAIFTPVRKANYSVESISLGEGSDHEKLLLEVWTDGTLCPTEAVSQSAVILAEQFSCFRELVKSLTEEGVELAWQRLIPPEQYHLPVDQLNLSTHTYNSLRRGGVTTLGQILEKGIVGLTSLAGFGAKSREEVEVALESLDLPFIPDIKEKKESKQEHSEPLVSLEVEGDSNIEGDMTDEASGSQPETE